MIPVDTEFFKGSLALLILSLLSRKPMYGYEIVTVVGAETSKAFELKAGSLYPSLHNLEKEGLIRGEWRGDEGSRQRKYYRLTAAGKKSLDEKLQSWRQVNQAIQTILENTDGSH
jgi:PadR family transcriptional regulator, regulatory protein PadR